jgi:lambda repressor-like predicted transcriptional regulator
MTPNEFGQIISAELEKRGWNARTLSLAANVPYDTARMAALGELNLKLETTTKIVVALGLKITIEPQTEASA